MKAVVDTNVWVSAFLTPTGTAAQLLSAMVGGRLVPLYSTVIEAEYRAVLARPKFNIEARVLSAFLDHLHTAGHLDDRAPALKISLPDPSDAPFIELARYARCPVITGDARHFPKAAEVVVLTPAQWASAQTAG